MLSSSFLLAKRADNVSHELGEWTGFSVHAVAFYLPLHVCAPLLFTVVGVVSTKCERRCVLGRYETSTPLGGYSTPLKSAWSAASLAILNIY